MKTRIKRISKVNNATAELEHTYYPQYQKIESKVSFFGSKTKTENWENFIKRHYYIGGSYLESIYFKKFSQAKKFIKNKKLEGESIIKSLG